MKILVLHTYNRGYLSSFFFELSVRLSQLGHNVTNFSLKGKTETFVKDGVQVIITKKGGYLSNYYHIYKLIKRLKPDVILSNFSYVNPALLFGKWFKIKNNVVWFHSLNQQMKSTAKDIFIKKQFLKLADQVIANSVLTQDELVKFYGVSNQKIKAIPFWSNISEFEASTNTALFETSKPLVKIGCPGRIVDDKNQKIVLKALSKIKALTNYDFHLFVAGVGEEMASTEALSQTLGISKQVTFLGHLSSNDMKLLYHTMDVVVLPSLFEAFGLVFIEAISLGTPVIVSSQFGALSFVDKTDAAISKLVFNPESEDDLYDKLLPYFNAQGLPSDYFKALYHKNFDKDVIFENIRECLEFNQKRSKTT